MHDTQPFAARALLELLRRSPQTYWTAAAAASATGVSVEDATKAFATLQAAGLIEEARGSTAFRCAGDASL
jgi:DNA-binding IscR family transcriptional regulator